jgi:hypothetical protein
MGGVSSDDTLHAVLFPLRDASTTHAVGVGVPPAESDAVR